MSVGPSIFLNPLLRQEGPLPRRTEESRRSTAYVTGWLASRLLCQCAVLSWRSPGLTARRASALILGWGALDEGENEASDMGFDGRGTL